MSDRLKIWLLVVLGGGLAVMAFNAVVGNTPISVGAGAAGSSSYQAIAIENPALHLDRIERLRKLEYRPTGRDIFTSVLPRPPQPQDPVRIPPTRGPDPPPPPPPLVVPFKYYGYADDARTKKRTGFLTNGDEVFIVSEGETLQGRYRIVAITPAAVEVEEVGTGKRVSLPMESQGSNPQG